MMISPFVLESVARELAQDIAVASPFTASNNEGNILRQVMLSIFSSRLRWETACIIVDELVMLMEHQGRPLSMSSVEALSPLLIRAILSQHRHPRRAEGFFMALIRDENHILRCAIDSIARPDTPQEIRRLLIDRVPGLGPKQSSLLLRNLGMGQNLAVLDRHVLRFMQLIGIVDRIHVVAGLAQYEKIENVFLEYAKHRRLPADALDLAVWIVMRLAQQGNGNGPSNTSFWRTRLHASGRSGGGARTKAISAVR
jgi:hypothetical protein